MPSQQLPSSRKVDTLPADLKAIAEELIRKKFNIEAEPEVVEGFPENSFHWKNRGYSKTPHRPPPESVVYVKIFSRHQGYTETVPFIKGQNMDRVHKMLYARCRELTQRYGEPFQFELQDYTSMSSPGFMPNYWK